MLKMRNAIEDLDVFELGDFRDSPKTIFLHGGPGLHGYMLPFCEQLVDHCSAVYYEQRGSKQGDCDVGISDHLYDLRTIVEHYSSTFKPTVVGHSWGAMLAVLFACSYPQLLHNLILVGCGPLNETQGVEFQNELNLRFGDRREYYDELWDAIGDERDERRQQQLANKYITEMMEIYQKDPVSGVEVQPRQWDYQGACSTMCESDDFVFTNRYEEALAEIAVPVTIINGADDVMSSESLFSLMKKYIPHVKTIEIAGAGHYPWVGRGREKFLRVLTQELNRHKKNR